MALAKTFMAIGIAVIFAILIGYGLNVIYKAPSYDDYKSEVIKSSTGEYVEPVIPNSDAYNAAKEAYQLKVFVILIIIGAVAVSIGTWLFSKRSYEGVDAGLIAGGVITIIHGFVRAWSATNEYLRLIMLVIILVLLVLLTLYINKISKERKSR